MQDKEKKMNELAPKMQGANQNLKDLRDELKPYEAEKKRLEKEARALMSDVNVLKSKLRKLIKQNKFNHKNAILEQMNCSKSNGKKFWKLLDKLDGNQNDTKFKEFM